MFVGCLNNNGTKTVYIFAEPVDTSIIENITGLPLNITMNTAAQDYEVSSVVEDATVYSNYASTNYGSQVYNEIGTHSTRGVARTYLKFDLSVLNITDSNNIISSFFLHERL